MYLCDPICNILDFSVFDNIYCGKHDMPWYGVQETDLIDVNEITTNGDLLVLINDGFMKTCYIYRFQMSNLAPHFFAF